MSEPINAIFGSPNVSDLGPFFAIAKFLVGAYDVGKLELSH